MVWRTSTKTRESTQKPSRCTSAPCTSGNRRWDPIIPLHEKSCGTMQCCYARWGEKLKRASWKRAFLLPEGCAPSCFLTTMLFVQSVALLDVRVDPLSMKALQALERSKSFEMESYEVRMYRRCASCQSGGNRFIRWAQ